MRKVSLAIGGVGVATMFGMMAFTGAEPARPVTHHKIETLTFWQQWTGGSAGEGPNVTALKLMINAFEKKYPYIRVKMISAQDNSKILTAIGANTAPDVIDLSSSIYLPEWASKGALMPLNKFINKGFPTKEFVKAGWETETLNGKIYGVPFMNFDGALEWNKAEFKAAGLNPNNPPKTLQQLTADAARLTKVGKNGQIEQLGFSPSGNLETWAWLFGGGWYNAKTHQITANSAANIRALTWDQGIFKKYGYAQVNKFLGSLGVPLTAQGPFESGKVAMTFAGVWDQAFVHTNVPKLQFGIEPFPAPLGLSQLTGTTYLDTNPQVIPSDSPNPQLAWKFIQFETTQPQLTAQFAALVDNLAQLKTVPSTAWTKSSGYQVFQKIAESSNAHVFPELTASTQYLNAITNAESAVEHGEKSPKAALDRVQQAMVQALK